METMDEMNVSCLLDFAASANLTVPENCKMAKRAISEQSDCFYPTSVEIISLIWLKILIIIIYILTSLFTLIGNGLVILVQTYGKKSLRIFQKYLINLAITDIISGVFCVPFMYLNFMLGEWIFPSWLCPVAQYAQLLTVFITSTTLAIIGIERYSSTLYPYSDFHFWLRTKSNRLLAGVWALGLVYAYIPIGSTYMVELRHNETVHYECRFYNDMSQFMRRFYMAINFVCTFIIPSIVLLLSYTAIIRRLCFFDAVDQTDSDNNNSQIDSIELSELGSKSTHESSNNSTNSTISGTNNGSRMKSIKIMIVVMAFFFVCWMPLKVFEFLIEYEVIRHCREWQYYYQAYIFIVFHWMAMANGFINPIIYSFMSPLFRNDLRRTMKNIFSRQQI